MCGIAGIVDYEGKFGPDRLRNIVISMRDTMVHRGPDDAGVWVDPSGLCALAHRRLSVIDLSTSARQPISNENGVVQATFNGEIYNFQELRSSLESQGHTFRSHSDSEVLPHMFETMDPKRLDELDGMFSFGVWHAELRQLLLARDPFGKKPLYYSQGPGWLAFASELQALIRVPGIDQTIDQDALSLYLFLQYIPHPWTIYRSIHKLPPGAFLSCQYRGSGSGNLSVDQYFSFEAQEPSGHIPSQREQVGELKIRIQEAVRKRLMSDVPLGAFLSGGVDSSLVVAMASKELGLQVKTFSVGYEGAEETGETEHLYAREVAQCLGTEHHEQILKPDAVSQVPHIASRLDEPNGDSSCLPTYLLSHYARQFVTVALSGDGGDEMFGGYGRYQDSLFEAGNWGRRMIRSLKNRRWFTAADAYLSPRWFIFQPEQVQAFMGGLRPTVLENLAAWRERLDASAQPLLHRMRSLDVNTYMPGAVLAKVDRMSMQASLEVRCPLLDKEVGRYARNLSEKVLWRSPATMKLILKQLASQYLPERIMYRKKMGFGLPAKTWSKEALLGLSNDSILSSSGQLNKHMDPSVLKDFFTRQHQSGLFSIYQVWPLLIMELWLRKMNGGEAGSPSQ